LLTPAASPASLEDLIAQRRNNLRGPAPAGNDAVRWLAAADRGWHVTDILEIQPYRAVICSGEACTQLAGARLSVECTTAAAGQAGIHVDLG
jgi:hypothetical protein